MGHTIDRTADYIRTRFGHRLHPRTISRWLAEYRELTTYARLRRRLSALHATQPHPLNAPPPQAGLHVPVHQGKLALLLHGKQHEAFRPVADYLTEMAISCPHDLFQEEHRASAALNAFDLEGVGSSRSRTWRRASLTRRFRPSPTTHVGMTTQRFMLMTDSVTVAVKCRCISPQQISGTSRRTRLPCATTEATTLTGHMMSWNPQRPGPHPRL